MTKNKNRFATTGFVLAALAFVAVGLLRVDLKYVVLGMSLLCIALRLFYVGRVTAEDGPRESPNDAA